MSDSMDGTATDDPKANGQRTDSRRSFLRVHVSVTPEVADRLTWLKETYGGSATDVVGRAISRLAWLEERIQDGGRILIEESDGSVKEVVFR